MFCASVHQIKMFCPLFVDQNQTFCALLMYNSLSCRLLSRDVTVWLFRLYWILFSEMYQLVILFLLEGTQCFVLSSCTTVTLLDSSPEM